MNFVCDSQTEAEKVLATLQEELSQYELRLNPRKTYIRELPEPLDTPWVEGLGGFELDEETESPAKLIRYFTRAFDLAKLYPSEPVLKYATRRLRALETGEETTLLLQRLLLQAAMVEPGTLYNALHVIFENHKAKEAVDTENLHRALNQLVYRHSALGHGSEVAWCIWAAAVFQLQLSSKAAEAVAQMQDEIVALTAMFSEQHGAFETPPSRHLWQEMIEQDSSAREHWLLTYEAVGKRWLKQPVHGDLSDAGEFMQELRNAEMEFLDPATPLEIPGEEDVPYLA